MNIAKIVLAFSIAGVASAAPIANSVVINPSDDGALWLCNGCINPVDCGGYLSVDATTQGVVWFPTAQIARPISQALFTVNPYGLALGDLSIEMYGIATGAGIVTIADANAGTFLGVMELPPNLGYGQDATFDVTNFLKGVTSPYVGFNLRAQQGDTFSSIEYNYGHPSQLRVMFTPEPSAAVLFSPFAVIVISTRRRRSTSHTRV